MTTCPAPDISSERLIFVAGLHRSGTTPLASVLAAHEQVSGFRKTGVKEDEGQHLQTVYPPARDLGGAGRFALDPRAHLTEGSPLATEQSRRLLLAQWAPHWNLEKPFLLEKSPPNLVMTRLLQSLFPRACFVVVVRHPVVVALSTRRWSGPLTGLSSLLRHWLHAHEVFLADAAHLRRLQVVRYEELVTEPAGTLAGVASFLGLSGPIGAEELDGRRSDRYVEAWKELTSARSPLTRVQLRRLRRRYEARINAFGYDFDDLGRLGEFPQPPFVESAAS